MQCDFIDERFVELWSFVTKTACLIFLKVGQSAWKRPLIIITKRIEDERLDLSFGPYKVRVL